jgi:D-alanyl-D-alanine carboxypeptidase/D-alanyl-D-alanine-endopeptidase (penicillin-binding protein 4)
MLVRICLCLLLGFPLVAGALEPGLLPDPVRDAMRRYKVPVEGVSMFVQEVGAAKPLLSISADIPRNPASTIKLLTTWVALEELGPAWTWTTEAFLDGELESGVLRGDLILRGYGDPYFISERLWAFQRQLRLRGLYKIEGDLVIDNSYFDVPVANTREFDGEGLRSYNVAPDAMLVNFQAMNLVFSPDSEAGRVQLLVEPLPSNLKIDNRLKLVGGGCGGYQNGISVKALDDKRRDHIRITGKFGRACEEYAMTRSALTAPAFAYGVFKSFWEESGGVLTGGWRLGTAPADAEAFYSVESPPLSDVITYINKFSNNVMARQLFLTLGAELDSVPGTLEKSREIMRIALRRRGLELAELVVENGSGLSRASRISAASMGAILQQAWSSPWSAEFVSSMSLPGLDGTLRKRFTHESATGRMHLKTGRLRNVFTTAGYVHADSGREYVVVVMQNYRRADNGPGEEVQAALLRWVHDQ